MRHTILDQLANDIEKLKREKLFKYERVFASQQQAEITVAEGENVLNFCDNIYLGMANHPELIRTAQEGGERYGFGMPSVRFICGTNNMHQQLELKISSFLGTEDTILYSSCFDANAGLFETLLGPEDAVISDELNHASIIDGIRLCKAKRYRYKNNDMDDLADKLKEASGCRHKLIATDGVFSMDGIIANLQGICELAEEYGALVMVDDSHAVGFVGEHGRGTPEFCGVEDRIDIITGTLGKALGGASGGYTTGHREIIAWLRQRSRPYLFSNSLAPMITAASIRVLDMLEEGDALRNKLRQNSDYFRKEMTRLGFSLVAGSHPIIPVMLGEAQLASRMAEAMLAEGIYVVSFSYPVVPMDKARIRTQISAAHEKEDIDRAIAAFTKVGRALGVIT